MSFLRGVAGRFLRDKVRSSVRVEPLILDIERSQLRWLGHLFPGEVFRARPTERRPGEDPGHAGETISPDWPGDASVSPRKSTRKSLGRGKSGRLCLDCCPHDPVLCRNLHPCQIMHPLIEIATWLPNPNHTSNLSPPPHLRLNLPILGDA